MKHQIQDDRGRHSGAQRTPARSAILGHVDAHIAADEQTARRPGVGDDGVEGDLREIADHAGRSGWFGRILLYAVDVRLHRTQAARETLERLFGLMGGTAPYQASLDDVKWTEGPIPGRPVLTFAPKYFISLRGVREQAAVDVAKFVDATDEAGFVSAQNRTGNVAAPDQMARPTALETMPMASRATVKPRKTKPRLQPVSWLIGAASTPRQ